PLSVVMVPVVKLLGGEEALHYPMHMILLPQMYHQVYLPLAILVGFALFGWAVSLMVDYYERAGVDIPGLKRRPTASMIPSLVVLGLIYVGVITAVQLSFNYIGSTLPVGLAALLVSVVGVALVVAVQALLIYSVFFLVTRTSNPLEAVGLSARYGLKHPGLTVMIVLTVLLVHLPVDFLSSRADKIALKFDPQLVVVLLSVGIVFEILTNFFLFASTTAAVTGGRKVGME
ncbi:MAG: hypothetical protein KAJ17_12105, partial [Candidatus Krumholzibacteria bacterium]|nr:hypothetical protein [Candidatus Krumholzibacteria bacterium]